MGNYQSYFKTSYSESINGKEQEYNSIEMQNNNGKGAVRLRQRKNGKTKEQTINNIDIRRYTLGSTNCHLLDRF